MMYPRQPWSSFTTSKRTYATAALLWSLPQRGLPLFMVTPPRNKTMPQIFASNDALLYGLGLSAEEGFIGRGEGSQSYISSHLIWHHLTEPISSTQDEARRLLHEHHPGDKALAVFADIQLEGRGTQGRKWERGDISFLDGGPRKDGNLYLTVCIPQDRIPISITLLPLQIGVFVAERILQLTNFCFKSKDGRKDDDASSHNPPRVTLKWPNDVLVDEQKVSGTLIEFESVKGPLDDHPATWMLIGIGINVASAPRNLSQLSRPGKHIRPACCIDDFCLTTDKASSLPEQTAVILGQDLASAIANWVFLEDKVDQWQREEELLQRWNSYAEWGAQYELRGRVVNEEEGGYEGEKVTTVGIERDGQLRVRGADGRERLLVAEYLF